MKKQVKELYKQKLVTIWLIVCLIFPISFLGAVSAHAENHFSYDDRLAPEASLGRRTSGSKYDTFENDYHIYHTAEPVDGSKHQYSDINLHHMLYSIASTNYAKWKTGKYEFHLQDGFSFVDVPALDTVGQYPEYLSYIYNAAGEVRGLRFEANDFTSQMNSVLVTFKVRADMNLYAHKDKEVDVFKAYHHYVYPVMNTVTNEIEYRTTKELWIRSIIPVFEDAETVFVKHVDTDGNDIAETETLTGLIGDTYNTQAKTIDGWTLKTTPDNANGTFSDVEQTVTYVYERTQAKNVLVKHVDTDGNDIAETDTLTGFIGDDYSTHAKTIDGWTLTAIPDNANGIFSDTEQTVTYVYERTPAQNVLVKHVDTDGNEIAEAETLTGFIGDDYSTQAKTLDGWTLTATPDNANGTFSGVEQTVTYVYERTQAKNVLVKHVDTDGNDIAETETLTGFIGDDYSTHAKTIDGWTLTAIPDNANGIFSDTEQIVTYVYERTQAKNVLVKHVDTDGNDIAETETLTGFIGDDYSTQAKTLDGWTLTATPDNANGIFSDTEQIVTYVYERETTIVTVRHLDTEDNELSETEILTGCMGQDYTTAAKELTGWTLKTAPDNACGIFCAEEQIVTYVYQAQENSSTLTVEHVDTEGTRLSEAETLTGTIGENYTTQPKELSGWIVKTTPDNALGVFTQEAQVVTYVYEKVATGTTPTEQPQKPAQPTEETPKKAQSKGKESVKKAATSKTLPKAGAQAHPLFFYFGLLMIALATYLLFTKRTRKA